MHTHHGHCIAQEGNINLSLPFLYHLPCLIQDRDDGARDCHVAHSAGLGARLRSHASWQGQAQGQRAGLGAGQGRGKTGGQGPSGRFPAGQVQGRGGMSTTWKAPGRSRTVGSGSASGSGSAQLSRQQPRVPGRQQQQQEQGEGRAGPREGCQPLPSGPVPEPDDESSLRPLTTARRPSGLALVLGSGAGAGLGAGMGERGPPQGQQQQPWLPQ